MKRIAILLSIALTFVTLKAADPDFAYPKTTLANAMKHYNAAISSPSGATSGITMIKSLLEIAGATAAIDPDSIVTVIPKVDKAIATYPDGADKALMMTIKAQLLDGIYNQNRWKYDRTETPDDPLPADITEWNGRQFQAQISATIIVAFDMAAKGAEAKISKYAHVIEADKLSRQYFPTIASFVALKAVSLINRHDQKNELLSIIEEMIAQSSPHSDASYYWLYKKLSFTSNDLKKDIEQLYAENSEYEAAGYLLSQQGDSYNKENAPQWFLPALRNFIKRFPTFWDINALKMAVARLTQPEVEINCLSIAAPNVDFEVKIDYSYTAAAGFEIYKISENTYSKRSLYGSEGTKITSISIPTDAETAKADTIVRVTIDQQGYYVIRPLINGKIPNYGGKVFFRCMPYVPSLIDQATTRTIIVSDYQSGAPIEGAEIVEVIEDENFTVGNTGKQGSISFKPNKPQRWQSTYSYNIKYDNHSFDFFSRSGSLEGDSYHQRDEIMIFTDRMLYHPGDTIQWAAISYIDRRLSSLMKNQPIHVEFVNTNDQLIDSINLTTSGNGCVDGKFVAPTEGLTGTFLIRAKRNEKYTYFAGEEYIEISDFKLPTFKVNKVEVERNTPRKGEVTLSSKALTYSGMPVTDAKVEVEIWEASRWRWFQPSKKIGSLTTRTAADGSFDIVVPDSITSQAKNKCFYAKITVAAQDGEVHDASVPFTLGKPYIISYPPSDVFNIDNSISPPFKAYDANGNEVNIDVRWWITAADGNHDRTNAIASGECSTNKDATIDLSNLDAGEWCLSVEPVDTTLADVKSYRNEDLIITTYSIEKNLVPPGEDIFVNYINNNVTADADGNFKITFGVPNDSTYVYQSFASGNRHISFKVGQFEKGFHTLEFCLPNDQSNGAVILYTVLNGVQTNRQINIYRKDNNKLKLECETMRDRLIPGSSERLRLKLADGSDNGQRGSMIATMFNSALNSLASYSMSMRFNTYRPLTAQYIKTTSQALSASAYVEVQGLPGTYLKQPQFKPSIDLSDLRQYKYMARSSKGVVTVTTILATEDEAYDEDSDDTIALGVVGYSNTKAKATVSHVVEVAKPEIPAENETATDTDNFEYRDGEVLQAFWRPNLTFDEDGVAIIEFEVPNAFGSWSFNAFAWTDDLRAATLVREFVAAKPVMVQPNLPRYLRTGDKAQVLATVYNNCDSAAVISTIVEIFDIATGDVKEQFTSSDKVEPQSSAIVKVTVSADGDVSAIGYRVRSTLGRFTDGEQDFIPIIASDSELIESKNFYLNPGDETVEIKIPDGKKMISTLDYTANPAWNIVKELPGLSAGDAFTSTGAARHLFGAATASGMLKTYPELASVIKEWSDDPASEALTSRLSQNDELKAAVLSSTPWVQAAASDTERMARLSLLFDKKATDKAISSAIATLKELQHADGGWAWGEWCTNSSVWATNLILQNLGRLNSIGYLPTDKELKDMIARAIAYYESQIPAEVKIDGAFTFITTLFPDVRIGLRGKQIVDATVQHIIGSWKTHSLWDKSIEALILAHYGYKNVASQIIGSISEFAVESPDKGVSFPSDNNVNDYADLLYAFGRLAPESKRIDGMRQWIIMRQQTTQDLGSVDPTRVIAAFASTGSKWLTADKSGTDIAIAGENVKPDNVEYATGHIIYNIPTADGGKTLAIKRGDAAVPAYGSVISRFTAKSSDVKAKPCDDLSIEKRVTALRNGKWQFVDNVKLGEQIKVVLTIKVKRKMEYVTVIDERPAAFEPIDQLPGWTWSAGAGFYRENRDASTNLFIDYLPKGTYQITIDMTASIAGEFTSGVATAQSQLAPSITAHSAGSTIVCE